MNESTKEQMNKWTKWTIASTHKKISTHLNSISLEFCSANTIFFLNTAAANAFAAVRLPPPKKKCAEKCAVKKCSKSLSKSKHYVEIQAQMSFYFCTFCKQTDVVSAMYTVLSVRQYWVNVSLFFFFFFSKVRLLKNTVLTYGTAVRKGAA